MTEMINEHEESTGYDLVSQILFPAPAGMNRRSARCWPSALPVPRASGDEPLPKLCNSVWETCSPRQRG